MTTPVYDFIKEYSVNNNIRLHMPGHKGKGTGLDEAFDITEIEGMDALYQETGPLKESQENAALLFGTAQTLYSAEGSSLAIRGMLSLIKMYALSKGVKPYILAGRNAHKVFMTSAALLDIDIEWMYPENEEGLHSLRLTPERLEKCLSEKKHLPTAVYITSPDYLGGISDIRGLCAITREYGVLLAVDNAHGAYLKFLPEDIHPITLGADICCDSAHKTLNALTGAAYLHISSSAPRELLFNSKKAMSLFSSTSPSFLILSSLDRLNASLSQDYPQKLSNTVMKLELIRKRLVQAGYRLTGNEPLKITLRAKEYGYYGYELNEILKGRHIISEFSDPDFIVFMFTPEITEAELRYFEDTLLSIERRAVIREKPPLTGRPEKAMSIKEALFSLCEEVNTEEAKGKILASPSVSCPPAIPVAVCGERLDESTLCSFRYYGIEKINVVK